MGRIGTFWIIVAVTLLTGGVANAQTDSSPPNLARINQAMEEAYTAKRYVDAAALGLYAMERGERDASNLYDIACCFALAGEKERAFGALEQALQAGWAKTNHTRTDPDLLTLHVGPRWLKLLTQMEKAEAEQHARYADPERAAFVTEDIPRFWAAFDKAIVLAPEKRAAIFQTEYLDRASSGMRAWIRVRRVNADSLTTFVNANEKFFLAARPATFEIAKQREATVAAFRKFKTLYPDAQFPDVVFSIGAFYGGGTVSQNNLLMSAEMYTLGSKPPTDGLNQWQKSVLVPSDDLPYIIAHEMIHFQQRYGSDQSLLAQCVTEGSANFLGEMCSGGLGIVHAKQVYPYGDAHERELWERFQKDRDRTDRKTVWLYSGSGEGMRPDDLGYYMGHKICQAYYEHAPDKKQAISDILNIKDFKAFLRASHYEEKFAATTANSK